MYKFRKVKIQSADGIETIKTETIPMTYAEIEEFHQQRNIVHYWWEDVIREQDQGYWADEYVMSTQPENYRTDDEMPDAALEIVDDDVDSFYEWLIGNHFDTVKQEVKDHEKWVREEERKAGEVQ